MRLCSPFIFSRRFARPPATLDTLSQKHAGKQDIMTNLCIRLSATTADTPPRRISTTNPNPDSNPKPHLPRFCTKTGRYRKPAIGSKYAANDVNCC